MRNAIWSGICAAVLLTATIALHAQQPSGAAQPPTPSSPPSTAPPPATQPPTSAPPTSAPPSATTRDSANKITVTGCLQPAPDAPTGTTGAAGSAASAEKFLLTNASSDASNNATGAKTTSTVQSYRLVANEQALAPHTGKKIEVTGTLDSQGSTSRGSSATPSDPSAPGSDAPRLIVESGKIIAPTCTD
jgi:hypothetical protein